MNCSWRREKDEQRGGRACFSYNGGPNYVQEVPNVLQWHTKKDYFTQMIVLFNNSPCLAAAHLSLLQTVRQTCQTHGFFIARVEHWSQMLMLHQWRRRRGLLLSSDSSHDAGQALSDALVGKFPSLSGIGFSGTLKYFWGVKSESNIERRGWWPRWSTGSSGPSCEVFIPNMICFYQSFYLPPLELFILSFPFCSATPTPVLPVTSLLQPHIALLPLILSIPSLLRWATFSGRSHMYSCWTKQIKTLLSLRERVCVCGCVSKQIILCRVHFI